MKVLFVTSEHPARIFGGLGTFTREYTRVLRKKCDVKIVYFHFGSNKIPAPDSDIDYVFSASKVFDAYSAEARILENAASFRTQIQPILDNFKPDVIHCNDRQTYMPFRFDTNVFYSSHLLFCDLLGLQGINDEYLQELKIEKCALSHAAVFAVYSKFAAQRAVNQITANCSPVVLPLAINPEQFYESKVPGKIRVAYFGRFEDVQKGVSQFIGAVQSIGHTMKMQQPVTFSLFGKGELPSSVDVSLFNRICFLEGNDLYDEFAQTDIVVMPSRYEPFGLTGLEAMASGCLLLITKELGMDEYAVPGKNCLSIPNSAAGIADVLSDAILRFGSYAPIRSQAKQDAQRWTWERCVDAHYIFYTVPCVNGTVQNLLRYARSLL